MISLELKEQEKILFAYAEGMPTKELGERLLKDLKATISRINPQLYSLIIDSRKVRPAAPDAVSVL